MSRIEGAASGGYRSPQHAADCPEGEQEQLEYGSHREHDKNREDRDQGIDQRGHLRMTGAG